MSLFMNAPYMKVQKQAQSLIKRNSEINIRHSVLMVSNMLYSDNQSSSSEPSSQDKSGEKSLETS